MNRVNVWLLIMVSFTCWAQAKDKHYRIEKEDFNNRIVRLAVAPTENAVWENIQLLRKTDFFFFSLTSDDPIVGLINIKAYAQLLNNQKYIDSINVMTDKILYNALDKKQRFVIVPTDSTKPIIDKLKKGNNFTNSANILTTLEDTIPKNNYFNTCAIQANANAVLIPSFSIIRRYDDILYIFQAVVVDSNGRDTLWTGDGVLRNALDRFNVDRLFNDAYIEDAVKEATSSISKKKKN